MQKQILHTIIFLLFSANVYSSDIVKDNFYHENALCKEAIVSIEKDSLNFVWVATQKSIINLAGNELFYVDTDVDSGEEFRQLINTKYYGILAVSNKEVYRVVKCDKAINDFYLKPIFDDLEIERPDVFINPMALYESKNSDIWFSTQSGVYKLSNNKLKVITEFQVQFNNGIPKFYNIIDLGSMVFAFGSNGSMHRVVLDKMLPVSCNVDIEEVCAIEVSGRGEVFIGNTEGVYKLTYRPNQNKFFAKKIASDISVTSIKSVEGKGIVIGTYGSGAFYLQYLHENAELIRLVGTEAENIISVFCNKSSMWIGTDNGMMLYKCVPFKLVHHPYKSNAIRYVKAQSSDLFITEGVNLIKCDKKSGLLTNLFKSKRGDLECLEVNKSQLVVSTSQGWILTYSFATGRVEEFFTGSNNSIYDIAIESKGGIWFVQKTDLWRLAKLDGGNILDVKIDQGLDVEVHSVFLSENGQLYFGSNGIDNYLYKYNAESGKFNNISKSIESESIAGNFVVYDEYVVSESEIYIATNQGVWLVGKDNAKKISIGSYTDEVAFGLDIDKYGALWISTKKGVIRYKDKAYYEFTKKDGLPSSLLMHRSLDVSDNGDILVGTYKGVVIGNINSKELKPYAPYVKSIEVSGERYRVGSETIVHSDEIISVELYSPNYPDRHNIYSYSFSQNGKDNWVELKPGNIRLVLSKFQGGEYKLKIRTRYISSTQWSDSSEYDFIILEPWYMRMEIMLFIALFLLVLVLIFGIFYRRISKGRMQKLEDIIESRTEELQSQNNELISLNENLNRAKKRIEDDMVSKEKFFSILAHDLKSPFNVLIGVSEILKDERNSLPQDTIEKLVNEIYLTSTSTFKLLENLLDWTRSQTGRLKVNATKVNLLEMTNDVLDTVKVVADHKGVVIVCSIDRDLNVIVDPGMLGAIIRNLTANAVKFSYSQSVVKVEAFGDGHMVSLKIVDQGVGIEPERINKMFDIGTAESTQGTAHEKGTGLGLLVCDEFAKRNNGKIEVESEVGKGSVFTLSLPKA